MLSVLTRQILWIALGVLLGIGIGHIIGRRQRRVDPDLNAAMKFLHEARRAYKNDPARDSGEPVPSVEERFLAEFGRGRGNGLLTAIQRLHAEAGSIPDPGGPLLGEYLESLQAWADTHPEVDRSELDLIIDRLLWMHR